MRAATRLFSGKMNEQWECEDEDVYREIIYTSFKSLNGPTHSHLGGILSLIMINDEAETAFYHLLMMMSPRLLMSMAELMSYTLASLFQGTEPDV